MRRMASDAKRTGKCIVLLAADVIRCADTPAAFT
jgi:hypothetical protein